MGAGADAGATKGVLGDAGTATIKFLIDGGLSNHVLVTHLARLADKLQKNPVNYFFL